MCDCDGAATIDCSPAAFVILLVMTPPDAALVVLDPCDACDADRTAFLEDLVIAFLGAMLSSREHRVCILEKEMRGRDVPPGVLKICKHKFRA